jgi:hypothetical protein
LQRGDGQAVAGDAEARDDEDVGARLEGRGVRAHGDALAARLRRLQAVEVLQRRGGGVGGSRLVRKVSQHTSFLLGFTVKAEGEQAITAPWPILRRAVWMGLAAL